MPLAIIIADILYAAVNDIITTFNTELVLNLVEFVKLEVEIALERVYGESLAYVGGAWGRSVGARSTA